MKYYLILFLMLWATSVFAVELRSKPVQCGGMKSLLEVIDRAEEKALIGGLSEVTLDDRSKQIMPVYVFVNIDTGTFTIIEVQLASDEVCVLGYGNGIDFDVDKYFEKKSES